MLKKRTIILIVLFHCYSMFSQNNHYIFQLNNNWLFAEEGKKNFRKTTIPTSVQQDLIRYGDLPNPYWRTNEKDIQWVEDKNWIYKTEFIISNSLLNYQQINLIFDGLDTYADVFLNGIKVFSANNMFLGYSKPIKKILKKGTNKLEVRFLSPIQHLIPLKEKTGFDYPADNDHRAEKVSVYARKAPYHFGWDWGMRMVQMGIWRPVKIEFYNYAKIKDVFIKQLSITPKKADLSIQIEINSLQKRDAELNIEYSSPITKEKTVITKKVQLEKGNNLIKIPYHIKNPQLWYPRNWGKQPLYHFSVKIKSKSHQIDSFSNKVGLRTIKLIQKKDSAGRSFYFEVNGQPLFIRGANYIPGEIMTSKQDSAYYQRLFENVTTSHMNMLRVWGGGIYENDYFYQLADEKGILIWQDFMFACTPYPADTLFLENVKKEAKYNIIRLRNHPSLALWCGNNEISEGLKYWGWDKKYSKNQMSKFKIDYQKLFKKLLPNIIEDFDSNRDYIHTSPDSANWGRPNTLGYRDAHYWGVWYGREPFEILNDRIPRFMSEFGFQSFPEMKTIRSFAPKDEWSLYSETMKSHQKSSIGNEVILQYMKRDYIVPDDFEKFVYISQVMQAEGIKKGIESHRRNKPHCMGTLYWQLNDSWPVVSWSGIDYYGNWKALQYAVRDSYKPITIDVFQNKELLTIYSISDVLVDSNNCTLNIELMDFKGNVKRKWLKKLDIKANTNQKVFEIMIHKLVTNKEKKDHLLNVSLFDNSGILITNLIEYFCSPKDLQLPKTNIVYSLSYLKDCTILNLSSNQLAKNVMIEVNKQGVKLSNNFFDLLPNEHKKIVIKSKNIKKSDIKITHLRESYK